MAVGGAPAQVGQDVPHAVAEPGLIAGRLNLAELSQRRGDLLGRVHLRQGARLAGDQIEADLVVLLKFGQEGGVLAFEPAASDREARRFRAAVALREYLGASTSLRVLVLIGDGRARGVVEHDHEVGQPGAIDGQHGLTQHEHRQQHQADPQARQHHPIPGGGRSFSAVQPEHQRRAAEEDDQGKALVPGLLEADVRRDRLPLTSRRHQRPDQAIDGPLVCGVVRVAVAGDRLPSRRGPGRQVDGAEPDQADQQMNHHQGGDQLQQAQGAGQPASFSRFAVRHGRRVLRLGRPRSQSADWPSVRPG